MGNYQFDYLDSRTHNLINTLTTNENFNLDIFNEWVTKNNIKFKSNPSVYVIKIFESELAKGTFCERKIEYKPNIQVLFNSIKEHNIKIDPDHLLYISVLCNYIVNEKVTSLDNLKYILRSAVEQVSKLENKDTKKFISFVLDEIKKLNVEDKSLVKKVNIAYLAEKKIWDETLEYLNNLEKEEEQF